MAKKKRKNIYRYLLGGALALPVGATVVGALPQSEVTAGALSGMSKMAGMYPTMGKLAGTGMTVGVASRINKALKKIK